MSDEQTFDLIGCARCWGDGHPSITFRPLTHPVEIDECGIAYTHWALCPANGEPILMMFVDSDKEEAG